MDKIWIHHFTPESNWQSAEWAAAGGSCPKWPEIQTSAGKILGPIFWDAQGVLFIDYLEKRRTINSKYYIALLVHSKEEIAKNCHKWRKKCFFNKTRHCVTSWPWQWQNYINCISNCFHIHYSPDLAPSNLRLVADFKGMLQGKRFGSNEEVISETEVCFEAKDKSFYKKGIKLLEKRWNQCITLKGDYVVE